MKRICSPLILTSILCAVFFASCQAPDDTPKSTSSGTASSHHEILAQTTADTAETTSASITTAHSTTSQKQTTASQQSATTKSTGTIPKVTIPSYPIEHVQQPVPGTNLSFRVQANQNIGASDDSVWFDVKIARSLDELKEIYRTDVNPNHKNYIQDYTNDFFNDKAVIVMFITRDSGALRHKIDSLSIKDGELCISMSTTVPQNNDVPTDMAYWRTLIDVNKAAIKDIRKISCYNGEWK